ncbi:MAG: HAMP domain-containing histidine kinase [Clostridia bacterium]|nr:HAMP domain-containing histidine kinase [Clostridia bacterium]
MLFVIGAVLSVLSCFFRGTSGLVIAAAAVDGIALVVGCIAAAFSLIFKKNQASKEEKRDESEAMDRILSEVAHELKTPLTVIRGSTEVLADGAVDQEEYGEYYARILRQTDAMTKLVSDLLDATRSEDGFRMAPVPTDLSELMQSVCRDFHQTARTAGVSLHFEVRNELPLLLLDPDRMRQLAGIFLDNALKHTPAGGAITLFLEADAQSAILGVSDNGSGISPRDMIHIFDRYYKAPVERGGLASGNGIGLSVAKRITKLHDGVIEVKSEIGKGACFTVRIPLSKRKVK